MYKKETWHGKMKENIRFSGKERIEVTETSRA
jgi:hypothetical protein